MVKENASSNRPEGRFSTAVLPGGYFLKLVLDTGIGPALKGCPHEESLQQTVYFQYVP
jgi:hypothetical protein